MTPEEYKIRYRALRNIATKHRWNFTDVDKHTGRVSYTDETETYRADVYLSKLTVCLTRKGAIPKYLKKQTWEQIDKTFFCPRMAK